MLFDSVKSRMSALWEMRTGSLRTVGIDGFTTEIQEKVFIFSESIGELISFKDLVPQEESHATGEYMGKLMIDALVKGAVESGGTENDVENLYAAIAGDNMSANLAGAKIMEDQFPHVF